MDYRARCYALILIPLLQDCSLIGLDKPGSGGGVRPIAIGETWIRLVGLCAMATCPGAGMSLAPLQLAVGVPGGSQIAGIAVRAGMTAEEDTVTVQVDMRNAFNSLSRQAMLNAVAQRQPELLPFAWWAYRQPARLYLQGAPDDAPPLLSQRGVRQGDPCGPLFFCLALQGV